MHLVDTRFSGVAVGVGRQKIIGKIHSAPIQFGSIVFNISMSVLEDQGMDLIFGLDQLKRHAALIDLKNNCLQIDNEKISFLAEKDLPKHIRNGKNLQDTKNGHVDTNNVSNTTTTTSSNHNNNVTPATTNTNLNETHIQQLMALGVNRQQAIQALKQANGNPNIAASYLFQ